MRWSKIRHRHNFRNERSPPSEMLSSLTFAGIWIILLPGETRLLPGIKYCVHDVLSKVDVYLSCFSLMQARLLSKFLIVESAMILSVVL